MAPVEQSREGDAAQAQAEFPRNGAVSGRADSQGRGPWCLLVEGLVEVEHKVGHQRPGSQVFGLEGASGLLSP